MRKEEKQEETQQAVTVRLLSQVDECAVGRSRVRSGGDEGMDYTDYLGRQKSKDGRATRPSNSVKVNGKGWAVPLQPAIAGDNSSH